MILKQLKCNLRISNFYISNICHFYRYNIVFLCVTYIIPLAVMAVCYTIMGRELWGSKTIGQMTERHMESIKSKRKVSTSPVFQTNIAVQTKNELNYYLKVVDNYSNKEKGNKYNNIDVRLINSYKSY